MPRFDCTFKVEYLGHMKITADDEFEAESIVEATVEKGYPTHLPEYEETDIPSIYNGITIEHTEDITDEYDRED